MTVVHLAHLTNLICHLQTLQADRPYFSITGCDPETGEKLVEAFGWSPREAADEFRRRNLNRLKMTLLRQQKGRCAVCGRARGLDCAHRIARSQGGTDVLGNLVLLCSGRGGCHSGEHRIY